MVRKYFFMILGWIAVIAGFAGLLIPGYPTTLLLLFAVYCFARSSPRFLNWLLSHKRFGPYLREWNDHRTVPLAVKLLGICTLSMSGAAAWWLIEPLVWRVPAIGVIFLLVVIVARLNVTDSGKRRSS